jgi:hypothetical protein
MKVGNTVVVCGGNLHVHGFLYDEICEVIEVRDEPTLTHVALCKSLSRDHQGILMIDEVEILC